VENLLVLGQLGVVGSTHVGSEWFVPSGTVATSFWLLANRLALIHQMVVFVVVWVVLTALWRLFPEGCVPLARPLQARLRALMVVPNRVLMRHIVVVEPVGL